MMKKYKFILLLLSFTTIGALTVSIRNKSTKSAEARSVVKPIDLEGGGDTKPRITFFAHGLGGFARDWSNDYSMYWSGNEKFTYDSSSIIEKMRSEYKKQNGSEMDLFVYSTYAASKGGVPSSGLYKIGYGIGNEYTYTLINTSRTITFSDHCIVVMQYQSSQKTRSLETVCSNYKEGVDKVIEFYKKK